MAIIAPARPTSDQVGTRRRTDIDGLRTLAILLVVIYHVWFGRVSGGVDVFLMISAFFLTGSLAKRAIAGEQLKLGTFWARRFRRLLPAAAMTMLGLLVTAYFVYPPTQWPRLWADTWSSLFYVQNWHLAFSEVDYYARDVASTSPLQHFWSLSVQGQVFLLWPLLIGFVALCFAHRREWIRPALVIVFSLVFAVSLVFSVVETSSAQAFAYFDTRARLWEFAAGSLLALLQPYIRVPAMIRAVLGWTGIAGIVLCGVVLDVRGGFPGYLALWPILATAAIIVSGGEDHRGGPAKLLSSRPLQYFSGDAYALYLIHWPVLITWMIVTDRDRPGLLAGGAIIVGSMILARLLARFVEHPLQRAAWFDRTTWRSLLVIGACILLVGGSTAAWQIGERSRAADIAMHPAENHPGAAQIGSGSPLADDVPLIPVATALDAQWSSAGAACSGRFAPASAVLAGSCNQSALAKTADRVVVIVGDSHAQQLGVPMIQVAKNRGIGVVTLLKGGCTISASEQDRSATGSGCHDWAKAAIAYVEALHPDAVYTVVTRADPVAAERKVDGIDQTLDVFAQSDIPVIAVRDNPRFSSNMYDCVADARAAGRSSEECGVAKAAALADENPARSLEDRAAALVDFTPWLCPDGICRGEIGNVAVYLDDNHITRDYGLTLAPMLAEMLDHAGLAAVSERDGS
ncbi:O-acetyltransferase OatA [Microbacterium sp. 8M]|uniref:acyltransferase family protein n=1 Tax=Microbacterium sp. 8M TaxID=2653153 RepID=UPI0012F14A16|nr:acyltransferase family protein [Microbacterium sp. 8M]VXB12917.1 O-acetyltransferase OatA [Microbacterium sp. 8M]